MKYCDRGLFYSPVYFGLCLSEKKFKKELKRLNIPKHEYPDFLRTGAFANVHTLVKDSTGGVTCIICMRKNKKESIEHIYAALAHEAVHIWQKIRENIGENFPSFEFEAYSIQNICRELFEAYSEQVKS